MAQLTDQQRIRAGVAGLVAGLRLVALCQGLLSGGPETNRSVAAAGAHCPSRSHSISARVTVASQPPTSCHRYGRCCRPHPSDSCRDAFPPLPPCACACAFAYAFACAGRCARARLLAVERVVEEAELDEARGVAAGGPRRAARRRHRNRNNSVLVTLERLSAEVEAGKLPSQWQSRPSAPKTNA